MSNASDLLRAIEQRAERAIAQELRLMIQQILQMRPALVLGDRAHADGLLLKLDRLIDDQIVNSTAPSEPLALLQLPVLDMAPALPDLPPLLPLDELLQLTPSDYEVRWFHREYGDLEDVAIVESFPQALQLATERHRPDPRDQADIAWSEGRGSVTVSAPGGTVVLQIAAIEKPQPTVQAHIARACLALEQGDPAAARQLFIALRQAA